MRNNKEKRLNERIDLANITGSVELSEKVKAITILNASEEGVCIEGAELQVDSVVRLEINHPEDSNTAGISLYCKVVWASGNNEADRKSGLLFLNTNKILFKNDLISFSKLVDSARQRSTL